MAYAGKPGEQPFQRPNSARHNSSRAGAVTTGLAIGLLIGAGVALLIAPREGSEIRRSARRTLRRLGWRGQDAWLDLRAELHRAARKARRARRRARAEGEILLDAD